MNKKDTKKIEENLQTIKDIGSNKLGGNVKKKAESTIKGALIGGGIGIVIGVALRKNPLIFGLVGLVAGKLILK